MLACCCACSCYFYLRRCCKPGSQRALRTAKLEPRHIEMVAGGAGAGAGAPAPAVERDDGASGWEEWRGNQEGGVSWEPSSEGPPQRPLPSRPVPPPKPAHLLRSTCEMTSAADGVAKNDERGCVGVAATGVSTDRVCATVWQVRGRERGEGSVLQA